MPGTVLSYCLLPAVAREIGVEILGEDLLQLDPVAFTTREFPARQGRCELAGSGGVVVALRGALGADGRFHVFDLILYAAEPEPPGAANPPPSEPAQLRIGEDRLLFRCPTEGAIFAVLCVARNQPAVFGVLLQDVPRR